MTDECEGLGPVALLGQGRDWGQGIHVPEADRAIFSA